MKENDYWERWTSQVKVKVQQYLIVLPSQFDYVLRQACGGALHHKATADEFSKVLAELAAEGKVKLHPWDHHLIVKRPDQP